MLYVLRPTVKNGNVLRPQNTYYTEEYAEKVCNLYLTRETVRNEHGDVDGYYRLHATNPHSVDMALAYDIKCPKCHTHSQKQVGHCLNHYELGLYHCPICDKKEYR